MPSNSKQLCPVCGKVGVTVSGPSKSPVLFVLSHPDWADVITGRAFSLDPTGGKRPKTTSGAIMQAECMHAALDLPSYRIACLWIHQEMKKKECFEIGRDIVLEEAKDRQAIVLIGAQAVTYFTGYNVSDVNGLPISSGMLSAPIIYPLVNPSQVLLKGAGIGELRFGLEEISARFKQEKLA